nr:hypothetical protein KS05_26380 [Rhizobium brockwellii]
MSVPTTSKVRYLNSGRLLLSVRLRWELGFSKKKILFRWRGLYPALVWKAGFCRGLSLISVCHLHRTGFAE